MVLWVQRYPATPQSDCTCTLGRHVGPAPYGRRTTPAGYTTCINAAVCPEAPNSQGIKEPQIDRVVRRLIHPPTADATNRLQHTFVEKNLLSYDNHPLLLMYIGFVRAIQLEMKDHYPMPFIDQVSERLSKHTLFCFLDGCSIFSQME